MSVVYSLQTDLPEIWTFRASPTEFVVLFKFAKYHKTLNGNQIWITGISLEIQLRITLETEESEGTSIIQ